MEARVIIGAAFGDEGKGLLTDAFAARAGGDATVVRFNGGAQAGHTVVADGRRHVFSHIGSGALAGARTWLSEYFIANPAMLAKEVASLGFLPRIAIHPDAPVTTPFDVMLNQLAETARGSNRHGSVGLGIGETIEREEKGFGLHVRDLADPAALRRKLGAIASDWLPRRMAALGLPAEARGWGVFETVSDEDLAEGFAGQAGRFLDMVSVEPAPDMTGALILEGAQGLLLDQELGDFPYVTRSFTGLRNVAPLAARLGLRKLDVIYPHRIYATRHGAGPFPHETAEKPYAGIADPTNAPNDWQGSLRFGHPDFARVGRTIAEDLRRAAVPAGVELRQSLAITCLDQTARQEIVLYDGELRHIARDAAEALQLIEEKTGLPVSLSSRGPGRSDVRVENEPAARAA